MARLFAGALALSLLLAWSSAAIAAGRRLVLCNADETYAAAVFAALAAWEAEIVNAPIAVEDGDPEAAGRAVALRYGADAVSWVREREDASELVLFDADSGRVTTRALEHAPPFDEVRAAAVALTIKTALRTTRIAPPAERSAPAEPVAATRSPDEERSPIAVRLEVDGGVARATTAAPEGRGNLALSVWPRPAFGVALRLSAGPGSPADTDEIDATLVDLSGSLSGRVRLDASRVGVGFALGPAVHAMNLHGKLTRNAADFSVARVNPAIDGAATFEIDLERDRVRLVVRAGAAAFLRAQRFLVAGRPTFEPSPLLLEAGAGLSVRLD